MGLIAVTTRAEIGGLQKAQDELLRPAGQLESTARGGLGAFGLPRFIEKRSRSP